MTSPSQIALFPEVGTKRVVNVASVKQLSPFRYPGGKTWLVPRIRQWLNSLSRRPALFLEPFCGGGIISLTVAAERMADHVIMVELDKEVAAVWQTCLSDNAEVLAQRILEFDLTPENVQEVIEQVNSTTEQRAFRTILRNRVNHGGILAPGAGMLKYGEKGRGLLSRWYPETLAERIRTISRLKDRIDFTHGDGTKLIEKNAHNENAAFFMDPPYSVGGKKAGSRLYTHFQLDHEKLFRLAEAIGGDFLMTYDNAPEIAGLAIKHGFDTQAISMKNTHHAEMTELAIGRRLIWARS